MAAMRNRQDSEPPSGGFAARIQGVLFALLGRDDNRKESQPMPRVNEAVFPRTEAVRPGTETRSALEAFWARAAMSKLEAKFALAREMDALPDLSIEALRAIVLQYRYFTRAFITDLALLVARCPEGRLRSLLGQLVNEELGLGDPEEAHARLYDCFLESIGAIERGATSQQLEAAEHPDVSALLTQLNDRSANRSLLYAIGMRGLGGECVCGVYFSVMHVHLRKHPFIINNEANIDWRFWDIHAGHADVEHNEQVRASVAELLEQHQEDDAIAELAAGYDFGTATWDAFWTAVYREHGVQVT
jgi:hypothetical protein